MRFLWPISASSVLLFLGLAALAPVAQADGTVDTTTTVFYESGGPLNMTVITPSVSVGADLGENLALHAGWEADVVSGASVAVVDAPAAEVDAVTSATKLDDFRNVVGGSVDFGEDYTRLSVGYHYGFESDYRSHSLSISGHAEMFERNTSFDISYARGFDSVCNFKQPNAQEAVDRQRLPSSDGCFSADDRTSNDLDIQTFQGAWTQAWTSIFTTQVSATAQVLEGYQGNPYRAVWLGRAAAQEHHPENRARYALNLAGRLWIAPLDGAVQLSGRLYRDTWNIQSVTAELAYDQSIIGGLSARLRGRFYAQTSAAFYSDDYAFDPVGQYFTGDRELSAMRSETVGGSLRWAIPTADDGLILGFMNSFDLSLKVDMLFNDFLEFHYAKASVPNTNAFIGTLSLTAVF